MVFPNCTNHCQNLGGNMLLFFFKVHIGIYISQALNADVARVFSKSTVATIVINYRENGFYFPIILSISVAKHL